MDNVLKISDLKGIDHYLKPSLTISTVLFIAGITLSFLQYLLRGNAAGMVVDSVCITLLATVYVLFRMKKLTANKALIFHVAALTVNFSFSMVMEALAPGQYTEVWIFLSICVSIVPMLLAGMTTLRWFPWVVSSLVVVGYSTASILLGNLAMIALIPMMPILFLGLSGGYSYILWICRLTERENIKITKEQENILNYFYFTPQQWDKVKQGRMEHGRLEAIIAAADRTEKEKMVREAKGILLDNDKAKAAMRRRHSGLTHSDLELCCLILRGYSSGDIARIQGLKLQSVTSRRSRLRTKLGLSAEQNLNDYLHSLVTV